MSTSNVLNVLSDSKILALNSNILNVTDYSTAWTFITETPVYGNFMVWHLILFMVLGPMLTWPMLTLLLLVFGTQTAKLVKDVRSSRSING
jgi:hypothetical protein